MILPRKIITPALWLLLTAAIAGYYYYVFQESDDKSALLPGKTTHGHYQIELECSACHDQELQENIFTSAGVTNESCNKCHGEDLEAASDSHPTRKFKNPENAIYLTHVDAMQCISCHTEHNGKVTGEMGVTIPADYCAHCHEVTLENLDSHKFLPYNSCATTGCHNYHDNRMLSPSFLRKHYAEPANLEKQTVPPTSALARWIADGNTARSPLAPEEADAPAKSSTPDITASWHQSSHAAAGINCTDCHGEGEKWVEQPDHTSCASCHDGEVEGFLKGKHGMRLSFPNLTPMTPAEARRPMKESAAHESLSCSSCHDPHKTDRQFAAQQACVKCHDDEHTKNYAASPHAKLWDAELAGTGSPGTGVSCATCHMPREKDGNHFAPSHNQNTNLTPNDKMLQNVCMECHGMQFAMDSMADTKLISKNFSGKPSAHHGGIDMAAEAAISRGDERIIELKAYLESLANDPPPSEEPEPANETK